MRTGYIQMTPEWGNVSANWDSVRRHVMACDADLLVLPEFFNTGYLFLTREEVMDFAEPVPDGPTTRFLLDLAVESRTCLVAGLPERAGDRLFNTALLVTSEGRWMRYRKTHLFDTEKQFFDPGDTGFIVVDIGICRVGVMICFDWLFPESVRTLTLCGAQVIAHPANLVLPFCPAAMITRCLENRIFSVTANRSGSEHRNDRSLHYIGCSRIVAPDGTVLAESGSESQDTQIVEMDPREADNKWITLVNHVLQDRRIHQYRMDRPFSDCDRLT
ncbi:acyltransferase [bacterium]|nr:acyltransferase [candidate division CSSED10-310 bacterium]